MSASQRPSAITARWAANEPGWPGHELSAIAVAPDGQIVTVDRGGRGWSDRNASQPIGEPVLRWWHQDGTIEMTAGQGMFGLPHGLEVVDDGVWVTDVGRHQVVHLNNAGEQTKVLGTPGLAGCDEKTFGMPTDLVRAPNGFLYVADGYMNARIVRLTPDGDYDGEWGTKGSEPGQFSLPHSITLDLDGTLLVADRENYRIQRFTTGGELLEVIDQAAIGKPFAVAVTNDYLVVADCGFPQAATASLVMISRSELAVERAFEFGSTEGLVAPHHVAVIEDEAYVVDVIQGIRRFQLT